MPAAILIDPVAKTVTSIEVPDDFTADAAPELLDCTYTEPVMLTRPKENDPGVGLILDEEGLMVGDQSFWSFAEYPDRIYAGKSLLVSLDETYGVCDGLASAEAIAEHVVFRSLKVTGWRTDVDPNDAGAPRGHYSWGSPGSGGTPNETIYRTPIFEPRDE